MFYPDVTLPSLDTDCSNLCNSIVFPAPILPSVVTIGTHIFTIVLQNNLEAVSTCEVLVSSIIAIQLLKVLMKHNTESKKWVEDNHNFF